MNKQEFFASSWRSNRRCYSQGVCLLSCIISSNWKSKYTDLVDYYPLSHTQAQQIFSPSL